MESFIPMLNSIDSIVWGPPLIALLVGTGIYLTVRLGLIQVFRLPLALSLIAGAKNRGEGDVTSFLPSFIRLPSEGVFTSSPRPIYVINTSLPIAPGIASAMRSIITETRYGKRFLSIMREGSVPRQREARL